MKEYLKILKLYDKHQKNQKKVLMLTIILISLGCLFTVIDVIRFDPFLLFLFFMLIVLIVAFKTRVTSRQYDRLLVFLKKYQPDSLQDKKLVFYLDYKLHKDYQHDLDTLIEQLKTEEIKPRLLVDIEELTAKYQSISKSKKKKRRKKK